MLLRRQLRIRCFRFKSQMPTWRFTRRKVTRNAKCFVPAQSQLTSFCRRGTILLKRGPCRELLGRFWPSPLFKAHPGPTAVFINELHTGGLQRAANCEIVSRRHRGVTLSEFSTSDRAQTYG